MSLNKNITGSQVATINVSECAWLGKQNELRYAAAITSNIALAMKKCGGLIRYKKAASVCRHLSHMTPDTSFDTVDFSAFKDVATQMVLARELDKCKLAFYKSLADGAQFYIVTPDCFSKKNTSFSGELVTKRQLPTRDSKLMKFAYQKTDRLNPSTTHGYSEFNDDVVFLSVEQAHALSAKMVAAAKHGHVDLGCYLNGYGSVNMALLRIAQLMGPRAVVTPMDMNTKKSAVKSGRLTFNMTALDYVDLDLFDQNTKVSAREDIYAMPTLYRINEAAIIPQSVNVDEISCAALEMLKEHKKQKQ